jgi:hypothetical protein
VIISIAMAVEDLPLSTSHLAKVEQSRSEVAENIEDEQNQEMNTQILECAEKSESEDSGDSEDSEDSESDDFVTTEENEENKKIEDDELIEEECEDKTPLLGCHHEHGIEEKNDSAPEHPDKICESLNGNEIAHKEISKEISRLMTPRPSKSRTLLLEKIEENEEFETEIVPPEQLSDLSLVPKVVQPKLLTTSPTAEEVSRFINDKSAYIEDVFKCMLRGISNSKLSMVKNGFDAPSSITELEEGQEGSERVVVTQQSSSTDTISPEVKIIKLIQNLDYFIDIICSIKSSDAKDTYSIIVLYEKLIFDLKSEISSLSKSLMIYKTIVGKKQEATR